MHPGRLVQIVPAEKEGDLTVPLKKIAPIWGVIINFEKVQKAAKDSYDEGNDGQKDTLFKVDILANCISVGDEARSKIVRPVSLDETGEPAVVSLPLNQVRMNYPRPFFHYSQFMNWVIKIPF